MDKTQKAVLIGAFVKKERILSYFEFLKRRFNLSIDMLYVYEMDNNDYEYIVTFKTRNKDAYLKQIKKSVVLHVKNGSLFSINALNRIIAIENNGQENINYNLDWDKYKDKLMIVTNDELVVTNIRKIEDKSVFLS